jgi:hypothetical protein
MRALVVFQDLPEMATAPTAMMSLREGDLFSNRRGQPVALAKCGLLYHEAAVFND